jgi:type II secretory pathway component PulC
MSQVHDALKRASGSDGKRPRQPDTQGRLKSVDDSGPSYLRIALVLGVILALALASLFFWRWWLATHPAAHVRGSTVVAGSPKPPPPPGVDETDAASSTAQGSSDSSRPAAAEEAWPVDLKLAGIIFNQKNSIALINGHTITVGDRIDGVRVTKIERDRVSLEWNGHVKVLVLTSN